MLFGGLLQNTFLSTMQFIYFSRLYVPVNSKTAPSRRAIPENLTRVKLRTVGNLTQNEACQVGHLTFVPKSLSVVQTQWDHLQQNALNRGRGVEMQKRLGKEKSNNKKMTVCLYKRANFADV